jgi:hypothetical protein
MLGAHTGMSAVGLDCEWQPTYYGGKGPTELNPLGDDVDHPVATLQLAFRNEVFIIDMLSISGIVTKIKAETEEDDSTDNSAAVDQTTQSIGPSRRTLTTEERALCAAVGELFSHTKIAILGKTYPH